MPVTPRQKACIACAESKRRCDKQLPECQRCLDRDVDCAYPQPRKRRRRDLSSAPRDAQTERLSTVPLQPFSDTNGLGSVLDLGDWGTMDTADFDASLSDMMIPFMPATSASINYVSSQVSVPERGRIPSPSSCPWFLKDDTWVMDHTDQEPSCQTSVELEPFVRAVDEMLQFWVKNGHCTFIHGRLYEKGMLSCLQDAFTTFSAYTHRTPAVRKTILQIAEERSCALALQPPPTAGGAQGLLAHLARVQALFVYEFIRLFDGSVRLRASAEQQIPTLRRWVLQMWEAARQYPREVGFLGQGSLRWTASEFDREYDIASEMWQSWILTECVRRTQLIVDTIANIYQIMTKGWADCAGGVMFTTRRGLWEAESAVQWFEMCNEKPPLLVPSLQPGLVMAQYAAEEIDDFVKLFWTYIVGTDKVQCWIDKSNKKKLVSSSTG